MARLLGEVVEVLPLPERFCTVPPSRAAAP